jgi:hypothetical protein
MDKKKTLKEMRDEIQRMIEASQRRQKGENVTSENVKDKPTGGASLLYAPNGKPYKGPALPERKGENKPASKRDEKPRQRPGSGKERMMAKAEEERKRRKNGESAVIG